MAQNLECVDCGMKFDDEDRYRKHRAAEHPRAEREDALQGNAQPPPEGIRDRAQQPQSGRQ